MMALPLLQKKLPAIVSVLCFFALTLLLLLTQDAEANLKGQEEKYARSGTLSQVGYQRDYTSLYQGKLKDMKYAYNQLSSLKEYYEVTSQFLYIPDFPLEDHRKGNVPEVESRNNENIVEYAD